MQEIPSKKIKQVFNILAKSLPITLIQSQEATTISYTKEEIYELLDDSYNKYKNEGMSIEDIKSIIGKTEPFKEYITRVIDYFDEMESQKL